MITDRNRDIVIPKTYQDTTHSILLAITIPLFLIGFIGPCVMIGLDAHDYQQVEDNIYVVSERMALTLQKARNKLCKQEIYYLEKEIQRYQKLKEFRSGSGTTFAIYHRAFHPYFSLFTGFDYRLKRLMRFTIVLGQICLITLGLWVCYSQTFIDLGYTEYMGSQRLFYVSFCLSLLTLPLPRKLMGCL